MPLLLSLKKSQYFYLGIILHILQDYDRVVSAGSAAMDMEICVTGSVHTWQCFLRCDASYIQWGMEFPEDSPFVFRKQQTYLVWTCWARSVMRKIAALTYYSQTEQDRVNQNSLFHSAHSSCPREQSDCVLGLFFFTHSSCLSHRDTYKVACQSQRK